MPHIKLDESDIEDMAVIREYLGHLLTNPSDSVIITYALSVAVNWIEMFGKENHES